jgi:dipeptidyl-peptidase-4
MNDGGQTMKRREIISLLAFLFMALSPIFALAGQEKPSDPSLLNLDRIFGSREFSSERFGPARWMKDGASYTVLEDSAAVKGGRDIVLYSAETGRRQIVVSASGLVPANETNPLSVENYEWSGDGKKLLIFTNAKRVWRQNTRGDYWVLDLTAGTLKKLGKGFEPSTLMFAKFSPDGVRVAYLCKNDIYAESIESGRITRLTWDGSATLINGTADWVYEEEFSIRDGFRWSPDGQFIAFWQFDSSGVKDFFLINNTDSLYPRTIPIKYPKPGEVNSACRIGIVNSFGGPVMRLRVPGDARNNYIARMDWAANSREVVLQHLNRLQNTNDVMIGDVRTGDVRTIFTDRDEAWLDVVDDFFWLEKGERFTWLSERDGWRHIYLVSRNGQVKLLTPAEWDVLDITGIDEKSGWLYFLASPDNPTQRYLFRIRLDGSGKAERVSPLDKPGTHSYQMSPSCRWAIHTYTTFDTPPVIDLVKLPQHTTAKVLADNRELMAKLKILKRKPVEFFRIDIGGDVLVDGWCLKPPDFDPGKQYPLIFQVYGEPAAQTVLDRWGGNGYLWHLMLAQQGYMIASVDNRGTPAPRGRAWRKIIYRQIGILASADQAAAAKALIQKWPSVDPARIGIWGWSGGGSMTLNAMFRYPEIYKTGIAVAFVANQRYYDSIYQERYMGLPKENKEGYKNGSPITFVNKLQGNLLIVHGTGDDNVHYQNFEALVNELVANNKRFSMMAYPNRSHGLSEGNNTTRHVYETFTRFLLQNLPPGPKTATKS